MAQKGKSSTSKTTVHRIKATGDAPKKANKSAKTKDINAKETIKTTETKVSKKPKTVKTTKKSPKNTLSAVGGYFKGAWHELKLVRWPTRSATWAMTVAVLAFTFIFVIVILLLDAGFNWAFEQILK